jgi:hypothetical protein
MPHWSGKGVETMMSLFGPILAAAILAQFQGGTLEGAVVDEAGKPVVEAQVVFSAAAPWGGKVQPVEVRATTAADGRFRLAVPPLTGVYLGQSRVWVYRSGFGITTAPVHGLSSALILRSAKPRTIKVLGPDGRPIAGALISPRVMAVGDGSVGENMPESLARPLGVTTGADGRATFNGLSSGDPLVAVRITAEAIGTQGFQVTQQRGGGPRGATITFRLPSASRVSGRAVTRTGQPVPNQVVEVWFKGGQWLEPHPVGFKKGPLLTAADGSFETPDNLLAGSSYRVVIRAPGMEPLLSDWITMGEKPRALLPMVQRPLRTISGRVFDRQGKVVAGIEVFQAGDGPERTATKSDADGRFALDGFCQGPVFLFARGEGFRFYGRLVKPGDGDIKVELTRTIERPAREMRMLPGPIPLAESRALALRLLKPYWADFDKKTEPEKARALYALATVDPAGVLEKIDAVEFPNATLKSRTLSAMAQAIAQTDAEKVGMAAELIAEPAIQLARDNPAETERILRERPQETGREWLPSVVAWKMAMADPARARRLVDESQQKLDHPQAYLYLALGLKSRDMAAAEEAFQTAMRGIDRLMRDGGEYSHMLGFRRILLPIVEQIDPALVPEYFWRIVATRPSVGNPRSIGSLSSGALVLLLAWYDRDVAEVLFEPIRGQMERDDDLALGLESTAFLGWSIFDPRAAVARLEKLPVNPRLDLNADYVRREVCAYLRLGHEARWRKVWGNFTEMGAVIYPD